MAKRPADSDFDEAKLSKSEKGKRKKLLKTQKLHLENPPSFSFDTRGFSNGRIIKLHDIRDLVLHLLANEKAQSWLVVQNKTHISHVVMLLVPGITPPSLGLEPLSSSTNIPFALQPSKDKTSALPIFKSLFSHACPTMAPGEKYRMHSPFQALINTPLTGAQKTKQEELRKAAAQSNLSQDPKTYLLTFDQMYENNYPKTLASTEVKTKPVFDDWIVGNGWIEAPFIRESPTRVFGLDCEMVQTVEGSTVARVSLVDDKGKLVFDSLIKPDLPITDYLTTYSGLDESSLRDVKTTLNDIHIRLSELIDRNTILVGHSLEFDLNVLKLIHTNVIDTSVIYQHPRGPPYKPGLKWLAQKWLHRDIQNNSSNSTGIGGHSSEEDARTCIDLLQLKMKKGPGFGEFTTDQETIFERLSRYTVTRKTAVVDYGSPSQWLSAKVTTAIAGNSDEEILHGLLKTVPEHDLTVGRFMELSNTLGWTQNQNNKTEAETPRNVASSIDAAYENLNTRINTLHDALPPNSCLIVVTGNSDPSEMTRLNNKKSNFDRLFKSGKERNIPDDARWLSQDERQLMDEVTKCKWGMGFFCVKKSK